MGAPLLVVGLGNPGPRFQFTRHNVGFDLVEALSASVGRPLRKALFRPVQWARGVPALAKPLTFMNRSGQVVPWLLQKTGIPAERLVVVVDNMDLPPGEIRMKRRGSPASHNGLKSISEALGHDEYPRLYVGVGRPAADTDTITHVLGRFDDDDRALVDDALARAVPVLADSTDRDIQQLISEINARRRPESA